MMVVVIEKGGEQVDRIQAERRRWAKVSEVYIRVGWVGGWVSLVCTEQNSSLRPVMGAVCGGELASRCSVGFGF